jgi:hypothetical protein
MLLIFSSEPSIFPVFNIKAKIPKYTNYNYIFTLKEEHRLRFLEQFLKILFWSLEGALTVG